MVYLLMLIIVVVLVGAVLGKLINTMQLSSENRHADRLNRADALYHNVKRERPEHPVAQISPREMQLYYKLAKRAQVVYPWVMIISGLFILFAVALPLLEVPGSLPLLAGIGSVVLFAALALSGGRLLRKRRSQEWLLDEIIRQSKKLT